ncbi:retrovirus-related pol polyprotein from transposon TNT 1-94 [Tanacetum coccineum]
MSTSSQQTLADSRADERPPMLERGNYIPWESRFRRFLDNKLEEGERIWNSIQNGPYVRPMIPDPNGVVNINGTVKQILKPLSKMTKGNKKQYIADVKVMNYLLQAIPNDIYNSVDACKKAKEMGVTRGFPKGQAYNCHDVLAREITQKFSTPTNNRLRISSNTRNQAVIQDGRVDIQTKNAGYGGNGNKNAGRQRRNQAFNAGNGNDDSNQIIQRVPRTESTPRKLNVQCYNCNEKGHYACDCQKPRVRDAKYFREQMLLAMKDEAGSNLNNEENDFMLDTSYGEETIEELTAAVMLMARIQPADGNAETVPSYDAKAVSEVDASSKVHEHMRHEKRKTIIQTSDDDQIDSNIIFDDPYVENNSGMFDHDSNDHDEYHKIQILAYDVQREAENQKRLNNELKKQKMLLQKELETCKDRVKMFE